MIKKVKSTILPKVDEEIQKSVDKKSLENIWHVCLTMFFFEAIAVLLFIFTRKSIDENAIVSIKSASFCLIACLVGTVCARAMANKENLSHVYAALFNGSYYIVFSIWTIDVSLRNYKNNEQILTFFAVQLLMVCFVTVKPFFGALLPTLIYVLLYSRLYEVDGGKGINIFNYALLLIVTIIGMIVRYRLEKLSSERSVKLEKSNEQLFYNNRHDGLTGLRNRKALEEDVPKMIDSHVVAYMIDINYFKRINDTYGHAVGDIVLKEAATWIKKIFDTERCYRYGGDEFLVLGKDIRTYEKESFTFSVDEIKDSDILLSIGISDGYPKNHDELFSLISMADEKLYEVKERTHLPN